MNGLEAPTLKLLVWINLRRSNLTHFASILIIKSGVVGSGRNGGLKI